METNLEFVRTILEDETAWDEWEPDGFAEIADIFRDLLAEIDRLNEVIKISNASVAVLRAGLLEPGESGPGE